MISKQIVEKFDGAITFESQKDKGSLFTFTFKLQNMNTEEVFENSESNVINHKDLFFNWAPS